MKKGLITILSFLLFAASVSAMTVSLGGPTGIQTTSTINFGCTVTATDEKLSSLTLWHNIGGAFQANETNSTAVTEGSEYTFTINNVPNGNYEWNCKAANESESVSAVPNNIFTVNVATNNAPTYTAIPTQIWPENSPTTIDLNLYFTDSDGDTLTYTSTTPTNIAVSISGSIVILTPQNWHGTATIDFTANDGKGGTNTTTANLNVTHANNAPYNKTEYFGNVTWTQNQEKRLELDDYFADNDGDTLTYSFRFSSGGDHHINVSIDNSTAEAIMIPETDWKGIEKGIFTAYDGQEGSLESNEITFIVQAGEQVNHAPQITSRSPLINPILTVGNSQKFMIQAYDPDLDDLTIRWYLDSNEETMSMNKENYTFLALAEGAYGLRVSVNDGEYSETENWTITVQSVGVQPPPPPPDLNPTDICGNGQVNQGETCSTCPQDVQCPLEYECKEGACIKEVKKSNLKLILIVAGGFIIFAAATLLVYRSYRRRRLFGGWEPKHTGETANIQLAVKPKEEPKVTEKRETVLRPSTNKKTVNEVLLKHYIATRLKMGEPIEEIKEKLKKVGWPDEKIDGAYKAAELDETFR